MTVTRIVNSFLNSNTFILSREGENDVFLMDAGDVEPIVTSIGSKNIKGIFLTHHHFDHVYGLNELLELFPECVIYGSLYTLEALKDDRLNLSYYYGQPLNYRECNEVVIDSVKKISLWRGFEMTFFPTPGHTPGSSCYATGNQLFTGDAYIPGIPTVTKLKGGNKILANESVEIIKTRFRDGLILNPGHGDLYKILGDKLQLIG